MPVMSRTKPERKVMALVATIVVRALMTWNSPLRLWMPTAPVMRSPSPRRSPVTNSRSISCTPSCSSASRSCQANSSPPPSG